MIKQWLKKINLKHVLVACGLCVLALLLVVLFYIKFLNYKEKEFDVTTEIETASYDDSVFVLNEGEKLVQKFEITIEEATAISVKIAEEQGNLEGMELEYSICDENQNLIQSRAYVETDILRDAQLYIHFDTVLTPGNYYLMIEMVDHEDTDASLDLLIGNVVNDNTCFSNDEDTGVPLVVKQSNFIWSNDTYRVLCTVILVVLVVSIFVLAYIILLRKLAFHWSYFSVALVLGLIFMFIIPPYSAPDEQGHISSSMYLSNQWLGWETKDEKATFVGRNTEFDNGYNPFLSRDVYNSYLDKIFQPVAEEGQKMEDSSLGIPTPYALYFIPSIGITIGRLLALNGTMTIMLGRLANLLFFALMVTYAIKKIPFGKMVIAGICLLPITLQQVSSFSYDNPVIASAMVVTSLGVRWCYTEEKIRKNEILFYLVSSFVLLIGKGGAYSFLVFLPFVYKFSKDKLRLLWKNYKVQSIIFVIAALFIMLRNQVAALLGTMFVTQEEAVVEGATDATTYIIGWAGIEGYTIGYFLQNPIQLIKILIETVIEYGDWCFGTLLGSSLGWFEISIPWILIIACFVIIILATIKPVEEKGEMEIADKLIAVVVAVLSGGICAAGMLLLWTPKGSHAILGLQGRYFLPTFAVLMLALRTKNIQIKRNIDRELLYANFVVEIFVIFNILLFSAH